MRAKVLLILLSALFGTMSEPSLGQTPRRVLVFGDSNTYGSVPSCDPGGKRRFEADERWGGVLRRELGSDVQIIEDGMINRAAGMGGMKGSGSADPTPSMLHGARAIAAAIDHHGPLDLVVMMLGPNDLQSGYRRDIEEIAQSIVLLAVDVIERRTARGDKAVGQVLIVTPPPIAADIRFAMFRAL